MCIFYASIRILEQRGNGTITVLSSDHYIDEPEKLLNNIEEGIELASIKIAQKLKAAGAPISLICQSTGLTEEEVATL